MSYLYAILMGAIQGATEFLPVSSSGHLSIFKALFHVEAPGLFFDVLLHVGTLIAVFICFWKDIAALFAQLILMIADLFRNLVTFFGNLGRDPREKAPYRRIISNSYRKFVLLIIIGTIPTGIIGVLNTELVERAGELLWFIGLCLVFTGLILLLSDRLPDGKRTPKHISYMNAWMVGIAQGVAILPGISRSGSTITACLLSGFKRDFAVKFSFILSIPAILGSFVFELKDLEKGSIPTDEIGMYIAGMAVAAVVGFIAIKTVLAVVRNKKLTGFSIYCFAAGALAIIANFVVK